MTRPDGHPHNADHTGRRCRYHDLLLQDGLCDVCERQCPHCHGSGEIVTLHPLYGRLDCPEPYVDKTCNACDGTGIRDGGLAALFADVECECCRIPLEPQ